MRVLGRSTSGNVQKVILLLEEIGASYTREDYGRQFGNTASEEYLSMNPTGKVPTLIDGDQVIWESNTVLRYIAATAGASLYPSDPAGRSRVETWMDWLLASLNGPYVTIFKAVKGEQAVPEAAAKELVAALLVLDGRLAQSPYLAGDDLSLADICLAPIVHRCLNFPVDLPPLESLRAWHQRLSARPAFQKVVAA
ncbi:MAG: glutathione S-transferase family protein [Pseudomonadota bacterium]